MFSIGQQVAVKIPAQRGGHGARTLNRKVMEIAAVINVENDQVVYKLRRPGSTTKGGRDFYSENRLEAVQQP